MVWARYSSAYFEQGASRQACNNPYDRGVDDEQVKEMRASNIWEIKHKDFMKLIQPSFACIDEAEDMDAIIARTHIIVITDHGIYWRLAHPQHRTVPFVQWPENEPHDLLSRRKKTFSEATRRILSNTLPLQVFMPIWFGRKRCCSDCFAASRSHAP